MGHGFLATLKLIDVGVRPSISIGIVASIAGDMFGAMRTLLAGTRSVVNDAALRQRRIVDPLPPMSRDVLEFATVQGARACGPEALTGSLTPGKEADIVLLDTASLNLMPLNNPHGVVVDGAHAGNVDTVMVGGDRQARQAPAWHRLAADPSPGRRRARRYFPTRKCLVRRIMATSTFQRRGRRRELIQSSIITRRKRVCRPNPAPPAPAPRT